MSKYNKIHIWIGFILIILFIYVDAFLTGSSYSGTVWNHLSKVGIFLGLFIICVPPIYRFLNKRKKSKK